MHLRAADELCHPARRGAGIGQGPREAPRAQGRRSAKGAREAGAGGSSLRRTARSGEAQRPGRDDSRTFLSQQRQQGVVAGEEDEARDGARGAVHVQAVDGGGGEGAGAVEAARLVVGAVESIFEKLARGDVHLYFLAPGFRLVQGKGCCCVGRCI